MTDTRKLLLSLVRRDEETRAELVMRGELFDGYHADMEQLHVENARTLEALLDEAGWPGIEAGGRDGAEAAWRVAQHAISLPAFQRKCLKLLREAVKRGEAEARHLAMLEDRVRFNERRPQIYGSIFDWGEDDELSPWPIAAPEEVEQLRKAVGLPPLAEQIEQVRRQARLEGNRPPRSHAEREAEISAWARRVGWL